MKWNVNVILQVIPKEEIGQLFHFNALAACLPDYQLYEIVILELFDQFLGELLIVLEGRLCYGNIGVYDALTLQTWLPCKESES